MEYLNENHYFTCTSGLMPAQMRSTQNILKTQDGYNILTEKSTATSQLGDFCCRWTLVLAVAIAAAGVVTGGAALLVVGIGVLAGGGLCGFMAAPFRQWINIKGETKTKILPTLTARAIMTCPIGGQITVAPGITGFWSGALYTARNTTWAVAEGVFLGYTFAGGGAALTTGAKATGQFFLRNFAFMQITSRTIGAADQVLAEGMLRDGQSFTEAVEDKALAGFTIFEQPFISIYQKIKEKEIPNWQDFYYAALSVLAIKQMAKAATIDKNMPAETTSAIVKMGEKLSSMIRGKNYERMTTKSLEKGSDWNDPNFLYKSFFQGVVEKLFYEDPKIRNLFGQRSPDSCSATCHKMVLEDMGIPVDLFEMEKALGTKYGGEDAGASFANSPEALKTLGIADKVNVETHTNKNPLPFEDLSKAVNEGKPVIASVNTPKGTHAVVIDAIGDGKVTVRDPLPYRDGSSYSIPVEDFQKAYTGRGAIFTPIK